MPELLVKGISASYGPFAVLHKVTLNIKSGEIVTVMGPNGSGKTTLLKAIVGVVPPQVTTGSVELDGVDLKKLETYDVSRIGIVLVPEGREIFPSLHVDENLEVASNTSHAREYREESYRMVYEIFPVLKERANQRAETLSGGERQMLCIAMGLMLRPKFFLLDEPSTGLAPKVVIDLFARIKEIGEKHNIGILIVEQQARLALQLASRGYLLVNGEIMLEGSRDELRENKEIRKHYLIH